MDKIQPHALLGLSGDVRVLAPVRRAASGAPISVPASTADAGARGVVHSVPRAEHGAELAAALGGVVHLASLEAAADVVRGAGLRVAVRLGVQSGLVGR